MPPALRDISAWPVQLKRLVESCGFENVWSSGLRALGFPPTWIHATHEAELVLAALERDGLLSQ